MVNTYTQSSLPTKWQEEVLTFWFDELAPKQWYQSTKSLDNTIRDQFENLIIQLSNTEPESIKSNPRALLAATIALDQFPRNSFRGSTRAFEFDHLALAMAKYAIEAGYDAQMLVAERQFCYMPFMHAENLDSQNQSVQLFNALGVKAGLESAIEHRDIIAQFGRFPHRNAVLGRPSTQEEIQYLAGAKRFGQ